MVSGWQGKFRVRTVSAFNEGFPWLADVLITSVRLIEITRSTIRAPTPSALSTSSHLRINLHRPIGSRANACGAPLPTQMA